MLSQALTNELKNEAENTRKMVDRVPFDKWDWKPHEKSMSLGKLTNHIVDMMKWIPVTLSGIGIDFSKQDYEWSKAASKDELMATLKKNTEDAFDALERATQEDFFVDWTLRNGEQVYFTMPRIAVVRSFGINHLIHHRAQLSVYLRLLDVPVPGIYGPSADEM